MKKIFQQYSFVKVVHKMASKTDKHLSWGGGSTFAPAPSVATGKAKKQYFLRHPWSSTSRINEICRGALQNGYIEMGSVDEVVMSDYIRVTSKGTDLIDTALFIPVGLIEAILHQYGKITLILSSGTVGAVLVTLAKIIKHRYNLPSPL